MRRIKPEVDVILDVLKAVALAQPDSAFVSSLLQQYQERGGLSKKQLQGLYGKASRVSTIASSKLATLEAIILKKHTRERSIPSITGQVFEKDEAQGKMITDILKKYPAHKRVLFFQSKYDNNEVLAPTEVSELQKFYKLLCGD